MPTVYSAFKDENVSGVIIGGDYICAKLCYQGRQQGSQIYAQSMDDAKAQASAMKKDFLADLGVCLAKEIYPDDKSWTIVFLK